MKAQDQFLKFVRWEEEDGLYVGYCPDLFPFGGVCHGATEEEAYRQLGALVAEEVAELRRAGKELPPPSTRPMRDAVPAWSRA
jgi:predicted RNase H-like HicB family nuclease